MGEPCEGRTTHHAGCACHEARRDAELASLRAQLATATASVQQLRADVELATAQRDAEACHRDDADAEAERVTRELAVLRAQQAPLVACVDALRAAAHAAGWRDADATGETLVAWVRRGGAREGAVVVRDAAMSVADDLAPDGPEASDCEWAHELMHRVAAAVARAREGGE